MGVREQNMHIVSRACKELRLVHGPRTSKQAQIKTWISLHVIPEFYHPLPFRVPQKEVGKRSLITFFRFRDSFGHFLVTFSDVSVTFFGTFLPNSEVSKRGWRTEGVGAKTPFKDQRFKPLFCTLFPMPSQENGDEFLGNFLGSFEGFVCRQPPPANPFSKLLTNSFCRTPFAVG